MFHGCRSLWSRLAPAGRGRRAPRRGPRTIPAAREPGSTDARSSSFSRLATYRSPAATAWSKRAGMAAGRMSSTPRASSASTSRGDLELHDGRTARAPPPSLRPAPLPSVVSPKGCPPSGRSIHPRFGVDRHRDQDPIGNPTCQDLVEPDLERRRRPGALSHTVPLIRLGLRHLAPRPHPDRLQRPRA